jgi:hypothetical protein
MSFNQKLTEAATVSHHKHTAFKLTLYSSPLRSRTRWHSAIWGPTDGTGRPMGIKQTGMGQFKGWHACTLTVSDSVERLVLGSGGGHGSTFGAVFVSVDSHLLRC